MQQFFTTVDVGVEYDISMDLSDNLLSFTLRQAGITESNSFYFPRPLFRAGYFLFPYIGGKLPARMDTEIDLSFLR